MTVHYAGQRAINGGRMAEICCDPCTEGEILNRVVFVLELKGWVGGSVVDGWFGLEVADRDEYKAFVKDYKATKKMITNCIKYGF